MIVFAGDSWALKGFTQHNYAYGNNDPMPGDTRLADHWNISYMHCLAPGRGNLSVLDRLISMNLDPAVPIIWVYTEPGRDYGRVTGKDEFDWIRSEDIFDIRRQLDGIILKTIRQKIKNPIGLIGGLSDIDSGQAQAQGFDILHESWQKWIADTLKSQWFQFGWGASDIGWRANTNNVIPSKSALFAWDQQIKEWCWWEEQGYFCHEHPTPLANEKFAKYLQTVIKQWIQEKKVLFKKSNGSYHDQ